MAIKRVLGVSILVLMTVAVAQGQSWQSQSPDSQPGAAPVTQGVYPSGQSYGANPAGYSGLPQSSDRYQAQSVPLEPSSGRMAPPSYPYPPYHNPYYNGVSAGEFLSGTVDWLFNLPSGLIDRVANFMDGNFFPQTPATQGGAPQSQVQGESPVQENRVPTQTLPPASSYQ
ncbi:MAG: hypothetical protein WBG50_23355 [Desulfomonilaceae bacterium]